MQLLFSFDQDTRVDETLMQTLACQLSCFLDPDLNINYSFVQVVVPTR